MKFQKVFVEFKCLANILPPHMRCVFFLVPRSVYDGQEHGLFMEKLDARIRNHDREIEKMCNHHFQGFVDSITELLKVRGEAQKLKVRTDGEQRVRWNFNSCYFSLKCLFLFSLRVKWSTPTDVCRMKAERYVDINPVQSEHVSRDFFTNAALFAVSLSPFSSPALWRSCNSVACSRETSRPPSTSWHTACQVTGYIWMWEGNRGISDP